MLSEIGERKMQYNLTYIQGIFFFFKPDIIETKSGMVVVRG